MHLPRFIALLALSVPLAAQGQVRVVDDGAIDRGAVWMVDMNPDGTLESVRELADGLSGLDGLHDDDEFGSAIAGIGDLDGNGVADLAVGAPSESADRGAVWILFRAADGSILSQRALRPGRDGISPFEMPMRFGRSLAYLGDIDGDGAHELAVGAPGAWVSPLAWPGKGEVRILSLASDGSVTREVRIGEGLGGFGSPLGWGDAFGHALAPVGDFDANGVADLAVGSPGSHSTGWLGGAATWLPSTWSALECRTVGSGSASAPWVTWTATVPSTSQPEPSDPGADPSGSCACCPTGP
jgi:hypothetical protein